MKKRYFINFLIVFLILVSLFISIKWVSKFVVSKERGGIITNTSFYAQKDNSLDVVFVGSSRVFCDINPAVLWDEFRIKSFDFSTSSQNTAEAPLIVEEIFKTQSPKYVVLEFSQFDSGHLDNLSMMQLSSGLHTSYKKIKLICNRSTENERLDRILDFPIYHSRYSNVSKDDQLVWEYSQFPKSRAMGYKGYVDYYHSVPFESFSDVTMDETPVPELTIDEINQVKEMCDSHNCELILIFSPDIYRHDYSQIHEYAEQTGITYINSNLHLGEIQLDTQIDFIDDGHLNIYGAEKWSRYLGKIIFDKESNQAVFSEDGVSEDVRTSFDENVAYYKDALISESLVKTNGLGDYFNNFFPNANYIMIVSLIGEYNKVSYGQDSVLLSRCGIDSNGYANGGTWVFDGFSLAYYSEMSDMLSYHQDVNGRTISITGTKNEPVICVDGIDYSIMKDNRKLANGLQVITFDKIQNKVIDAIAYDADNEYAWIRNKK